MADQPPLRKKTHLVTNPRRIGEELRRIGQQVSELPRVLEDEKGATLGNTYNSNSIILT